MVIKLYPLDGFCPYKYRDPFKRLGATSILYPFYLIDLDGLL